jgi:hypothetical protein
MVNHFLVSKPAPGQSSQDYDTMKGSRVQAPDKAQSLKGATVTLSSISLYPESNNFQGGNTKICRRCKKLLPRVCFEKGAYRIRQICNECRGLNGETHREKRRCSKCQEIKNISEFSRVNNNTHNPDGLHSYCKDCKQKLERGKSDTRAENKRKSMKLEYDKMDPSVRPLPKICGNSLCLLSGQIQPPENFDKSKLHITGLRIDCRLCELERKRTLGPKESSKVYHRRWYQEHKEILNKQTKEWREANPEEVRRKHIERRFRQYGVTQEWYDKTLAAQGGGCAMCGSKDPKNEWNTFHIDHDHSCCSKSCHACDNCRRGLLCGVCNTRLGILEKKEWVKQAKSYLAKYRRKDEAGNVQPSLFEEL